MHLGIKEKPVCRDPVRENGENELRKVGGGRIVRGIDPVLVTLALGLGLAASSLDFYLWFFCDDVFST